jgi:ankyrin repeat protein
MNCVRQNGSTPLHDANLHSGAVILLAVGANVCARDSNGQTALHRVVGAWNGLTAVHSLIAAGADLDAADDAGETVRQVLADHGWTIVPDPS